MYSLSAACFREALAVASCPQNISDISWQSAKLVIPPACTSGPYGIYNKLFSQTNDNNSSGLKTISALPLMLLTVVFLAYIH
jgi:hypothetical protein